MAVGSPVVKQAARGQVGGDFGVGVLNEFAGKGIIAGEDALQVNLLDERQLLLPAQRQVLIAEGGGNVDDAAAVVHTDEIGGDHGRSVGVGVLQFNDGAVAGAGAADETPDGDAELRRIVQRAVGDADQRAARHRCHRRIIAAQRIEQSGGENQPHRIAPVVGGCHDAVSGIGGNGQRRVARQRPGGGSPGQEIGGNGRRRAVRPGQGLKLDEHRRVGRIFAVAQGHFVGGKAGHAAGAVGSAAPIFVKQALFPELLEDPPAGFDVIVLQGDIGVFHIHPETDAVGHHFPVFDIAKDAFPAVAVEFGNAVFLDVAFGGKAEFLLNGHFHGQAVGVPAALAGDAAAFHRAVATDDVFKDAGQDVVNAGAAVGGGRPLVHHKERGVGAFVHGAAEDVAIFPVLEGFGVQVGEADAAGNSIEHSRDTSVAVCG